MFAKLTLCTDLNSPTALLPSVSAGLWSGGQFVARQLTRGQLLDLLIYLDELGFTDLETETDISMG